MSEIPLSLLVAALVFLIVLSGFFSGSETGLISLNRYRLKHLTQSGHAGAKRASLLLERPDRLIGLILLGNNFVNILASAIATLIGIRLFGETGIAIATGLLTLVILIFAEVTPKTVAALHPERFAFPAAYILTPLLRLLYPLVWVINLVANGLLRLLRIHPEGNFNETLSREELRSVVNEAGAMIPHGHQDMLLSILDLEKVTVNDIMVPRNEIVGIELEDEWSEVLKQLTTSQHTRLPVYRGGIDNMLGIVHIRNVLHRISGQKEFDKEGFLASIREPYYVPDGTPLHTQLSNFRQNKRRSGMVVNEYGDIQGLVTLEDILEEIVGEFTTDPSQALSDVYPQEDGTYLVDGTANIRELNRLMGWDLPTDGPKTLNGMILEYLENIPEPGTSMLLDGYPIDIIQTSANVVKKIRINPETRRGTEKNV